MLHSAIYVLLHIMRMVTTSSRSTGFFFYVQLIMNFTSGQTGLGSRSTYGSRTRIIHRLFTRRGVGGEQQEVFAINIIITIGTSIARPNTRDFFIYLFITFDDIVSIRNYVQ